MKNVRDQDQYHEEAPLGAHLRERPRNRIAGNGVARSLPVIARTAGSVFQDEIINAATTPADSLARRMIDSRERRLRCLHGLTQPFRG